MTAIKCPCGERARHWIFAPSKGVAVACERCIDAAPPFTLVRRMTARESMAPRGERGNVKSARNARRVAAKEAAKVPTLRTTNKRLEVVFTSAGALHTELHRFLAFVGAGASPERVALLTQLGHLLGALHALRIDFPDA